MKLALNDPQGRVFRFLHRSTPGGELIIMDLKSGYRGEIFCQGEDGTHFVEVRCVSTRSGRWDPAEFGYLVQITWPIRFRRTVLHSWSKGTLEMLLCPMHSWMPSASKKWTTLKEIEF